MENVEIHGATSITKMSEHIVMYAKNVGAELGVELGEEVAPRTL